MATTLRLSIDAEAAVKAEAARTSRSQQEVIRVAIDAYFRQQVNTSAPVDEERLLRTNRVRPPRTPFRTSTNRIRLPEGGTSLELLQREERI